MAPHASAPPLPLTQVTSVLLHTTTQLLALPNVVDLISEYLDVSVKIPLTGAAASRSVVLLERVALHMVWNKNNNQRTSHLLDPALYEYGFARAMQTAIERNDLVLVQKIHILHPEPLVLYSLQLALQHGTLEMIQWIIQHRADRLCCPVGIQNVCSSCWLKALRCLGAGDDLRIAQWALDNGLLLGTTPIGSHRVIPLFNVLLKSARLAEFVDRHGLLSSTVAHQLLCRALDTRDLACVDVIRYFVHSNPSRVATAPMDALILSIVRAACQYEKEGVVTELLASPICASFRDALVYSPTQAESGARVLRLGPERCKSTTLHGVNVQYYLRHYASHYCHLETLQWLFQQHGIAPLTACELQTEASEDKLLQRYMWMYHAGVDGTGVWSTHDMDAAASRGFLTVVQWLHANRREGCTRRAMDAAARNGLLHVVQWLTMNREDGCTGDAIEVAAANGHLQVVQWLHANHRYPQHTPTIMLNAAIDGQLDVVVWLHENSDDGCTACVRWALLRQPNRYAATNHETYPVRNTLEWLDAHQPMAGSSTCSGNCLDEPRHIQEGRRKLTILAACHGDSQLLEYLQTHHSDLFAEHSREQLQSIARSLARGDPEMFGGHLGTARWLYGHYRATVDWTMVRRTAEKAKRADLADWQALGGEDTMEQEDKERAE